MKKIIALALALVLSLGMATVAFAAPTLPSDTTNPGTSLKFDGSNFINKKLVDAAAADKVAVYTAMDKEIIAVNGDYMSSDYFTVKVEYERGKELVKEVKFDGQQVVIVLKQNYALARPTISNFQIKEITLTGKKDGVGDYKYNREKFVLYTTELSADWDGTGAANLSASTKGTGVIDAAVATAKNAVKIGYTRNDTDLLDANMDIDGDANEGLYKFVKDTATVSVNTAEISFADAFIEVKVYKDDTFFIGVDKDADLDIVKANPDAALDFIAFKGNPAFSANANVELIADEDTILYEIKDGKLVKSTWKYDSDIGAFVGKARTLGSYVISDVALKDAPKATEDEDSKNPNTGANDFVGVAVALAVVSLVAAGAVSLKK